MEKLIDYIEMELKWTKQTPQYAHTFFNQAFGALQFYIIEQGSSGDEFADFMNFPVCVIHTVKGFSIAHKVEVDVFLELPCFFYEPMDFGNLISGSSAFSKSSLYIWILGSHAVQA